MNAVIVSQVLINFANKLTYNNGRVIYSWNTGRIEVKTDKDTIETVNHCLASDDDFHTTSIKYSEQEEVYGTTTPEEYVEYLLNNGFFLPITIIGDNEGEQVNVTNGGLDVNIQDQHTPLVDAYFLQSSSNFTIAVDTPVSTLTVLEYDFVASPAHGIAIGNEIILLDILGDRELYATVVNVVGDVITIDRPLDNSFPAATSLGRIVISNMAVNGSITPQIFTIRAGITEHDITRLFITILSGSSMDDGKFGSLPALTNGIVFRIVNGWQETVWNFKTNQDMKQFCYDLDYSSKAPAGQFGLSTRMTFAGQHTHGVTIRISGPDDALQWVVQDDLTGLDSVKITVEGHHVEPNPFQ